jgi:2-polyprenyl-3-methyl-5-hydroxy-6-metoxy-1,4-benzoquinol methylase
MSINFWNGYYNLHKTPFENSLFSEFVINKLKINKKIIDIGCGNGRDSIFFNNKGFETLGIDFSDKTIKNLKQYSNVNLKFQKIDIKNINKKLENESFDYAYCRFLLHSLDKDTEQILFEWMFKNIKDSIFIETRIDEDLKNEAKQNHFRRNINPEELIEVIYNSDFNITYSEISDKFSPYNSSYDVKDITKDPTLLRIVAVKNNLH